jgi:hypothetical protein
MKTIKNITKKLWVVTCAFGRIYFTDQGHQQRLIELKRKQQYMTK